MLRVVWRVVWRYATMRRASVLLLVVVTPMALITLITLITRTGTTRQAPSTARARSVECSTGAVSRFEHAQKHTKAHPRRPFANHAGMHAGAPPPMDAPPRRSPDTAPV